MSRMSIKTRQQNFQKLDNGNEYFIIRLILHMLKTTSLIYTQVIIDVLILTQEPKYNVSYAIFFIAQHMPNLL